MKGVKIIKKNSRLIVISKPEIRVGLNTPAGAYMITLYFSLFRNVNYFNWCVYFGENEI